MTKLITSDHLDFVHVWPGCLEPFVFEGIYSQRKGLKTPSFANKSTSSAFGPNVRGQIGGAGGPKNVQSRDHDDIILGIDPGTRITGYGIIRIGKKRQLEPIDFGCIRPPADRDPPARYLALFEGLELLLDKYAPDAVAVETQFVYKNVQSAMKLGMARGVVLLSAAKRGIPIYEYAPKKAKLAVVGNGSASKEQVQKMIQLLLNLPLLPTPEDAADALALAVCHANTLNFRAKIACTNTSKER